MRSSRIAFAAVAVVLVLCVVVAVDAGTTWGRAYAGVHVGDIDVSGKTEDEIAQLVQDAYGDRLDSTTVTVYASEQAKELASDQAAQAQNAALSEQLSVDDARSSQQLWTLDSSTVSASLPAQDLAHDAVEVGRGNGGVLARMAAQFGGWVVDPYLTYNDSLVDSFAATIDQAIGDPRVDWSVKIEGGTASVVEGHDGMMVNRDTFKDQLSQAFLESDDPSIIAQAQYAALRIDQQGAQAACDRINEALSHAVELTYENAVWSVSAEQLGSCIATRIDQTDGGWALTPYLAEDSARPLILSQAQQHHDGELAKVTFSDDGNGGFTVRTDGTGQLPLTAEAVQALDAVLFGGQDSADVAPQDGHDPNAGTTSAQLDGDGIIHLSLASSSAPTELSFDDAVSAGVVSAISAFTTEYSNGAGTENRNHNIHLAADLLSGSVVSPEAVWSFNETAGNCNEEAGFLGAGSIVDGEYTDEVGGGICQVATTVFNAVYEAGLPVVSRTNHSLYIASYPAGRDAAVSWPYLDLQWSNDQQSDILLLMSYTDTSVTATLYGVPTGYSVSTEEGQWEEGEKYDTRTEVDETLSPGTSYVKTAGSDGRSIYVIRTVTDQDGNLIRQDRFDSVYDPITEVVVKGPDASDTASDSSTGSTGQASG